MAFQRCVHYHYPRQIWWDVTKVHSSWTRHSTDYEYNSLAQRVVTLNAALCTFASNNAAYGGAIATVVGQDIHDLTLVKNTLDYDADVLLHCNYSRLSLILWECSHISWRPIISSSKLDTSLRTSAGPGYCRFHRTKIIDHRNWPHVMIAIFCFSDPLA